MSSRTKTSSNRASQSQNSVDCSRQDFKPRHTPGIQEYSNMNSRPVQDDDFPTQDNFSLSSNMHQTQLTPQSMSQWSMGSNSLLMGSDSNHTGHSSGRDVSTTEPSDSDSQMLSFSFSQAMMPTSTGNVSPSAASAHYSFNDLQTVQDMTDRQMPLSQAPGYQNFSALVDFPYDNEPCPRGDSSGCGPDDSSSIGHPKDIEDAQLFTGAETWSSLHLDAEDYPLSSTLFHGLPVSPPLTEASNDLSVTSACSQSSYPTFPPHEDALFVDPPNMTGPNLALGDAFFPLTPPLSEQDPNRTIRPSKQAQRPLLSAATGRSRKNVAEQFTTLPVREPIRQKSKDSAEVRSPRDHPYYQVPTQSDGKYHCPYASGEKPCSHTPTTQKCAYHKYLDSHLKPYRCKNSECVEAHFSSNACLFRHEREAHGMHGHGENPHLCLFDGCDRSQPGNGFPRRWNLHDHMKRVHDYCSSERVSSPEASPLVGSTKRKDSSARKRKGPSATGAQTMKRTRSTPSHPAGLKALQSPAHRGQQLQNAERNYYNCLARLQQELSNISPEDPSLHEKANASLQELHTLGINYRYIQAGQAAAELSNGYSG